MSEKNISNKFERLLDVKIPMSDGVNLSCDIYLPVKNKIWDVEIYSNGENTIAGDSVRFNFDVMNKLNQLKL